MSDVPTQEFAKRTETLEQVTVGVTSYRVGTRFSARVDNVDPGTVIGRGQGATRLEAETAALESAALTLHLRGAAEAMRKSVEQLTTRRGGKA